MKTFKDYLIEAAKLNPRWQAWLNSVNVEHPNAPTEPSYKDRIPKEPGTKELAIARRTREIQRMTQELKSVDDLSDPENRRAYHDHNLWSGFTGKLYTSHHETQLLDSDGYQKEKPNRFLVYSKKQENGDINFQINRRSDGHHIHSVTLPAGEDLNSETGDHHTIHPDEHGLHLSITDASEMLHDHMDAMIGKGVDLETGREIPPDQSVRDVYFPRTQPPTPIKEQDMKTFKEFLNEDPSHIENVMRRTISSFMGKDGGQSYTKRYTPEFVDVLAREFHKIDHHWKNSAHEEATGDSLPSPASFDDLPKHQRRQHRDDAKAALQALTTFRDTDVGHREDENFEKLFSHFQLLTGRDHSGADPAGEHGANELHPEELPERLDRHKLVHAMHFSNPQ